MPTRAGLPVATLGLDKKALGPVTAARQRRLLAGYSVLFLLALVTTWVWEAPALGLSLIWPGGGLLHFASGSVAAVAIHLLAFLGVQLLFLLALATWVGVGNLMAPLAVWIGSALWAASMHHAGASHGSAASVALPALVAAAVAAVQLRGHTSRADLERKRDHVNGYLAHVTTAVTPLDDQGLPLTRELTPEELALARFLLDRALQPVDEFNGFDKLDQFREAATRYQIFHLSASLGCMANHAVPAMRAYLDEAQQRLMRKMLFHHVWSYWAFENFWGNFSLDPNPLPNDNVMYTGWYAAILGMYISASETRRYDAPGSLELLDRRGAVAYRTSFPELCATIHDNFRKSDFTLYACEPKFVYPICPGFGAVALAIHDRAYGGDYWSSIEDRYRASLEDEFVRMDGRITAIRCYRTGITVPGLTAIMADAAAATFMNGYFPDIARRTWEVIRHDLLTIEDGSPKLELALWDKIDFGNYKPVHAACYGLVATAAREMGDDRVAECLIEHVESTVPNRIVGGVKHYENVSLGGHAVLFTAKVNRTNGVRDSIAFSRPEAWRRGPVLSGASYPEVLVARAVSDGTALYLVLRPGPERRDVRIEVSQLVPNRRYRTEGALSTELRADAQGRATLSLSLNDRSELWIKPAA